jgi:hypothetical protein
MNKRPSPSDLEILEAIHRRYYDRFVDYRNQSSVSVHKCRPLGNQCAGLSCVWAATDSLSRVRSTIGPELPNRMGGDGRNGRMGVYGSRCRAQAWPRCPKCPIPQPTCCEHHRVPAVISAPVRDRQFGPANVARRRHRLVGSAVAGSPGLLDRRESRSAAPAGTAAPAPHR